MVLRVHFMETPRLYRLKLLMTLQSAPFHFTVTTFNAIQSELLIVSLTNEQNKKVVHFLPTIPGSDTIGWEGGGGTVTATVRMVVINFYSALHLP